MPLNYVRTTDCIRQSLPLCVRVRKSKNGLLCARPKNYIISGFVTTNVNRYDGCQHSFFVPLLIWRQHGPSYFSRAQTAMWNSCKVGKLPWLSNHCYCKTAAALRADLWNSECERFRKTYVAKHRRIYCYSNTREECMCGSRGTAARSTYRTRMLQNLRKGSVSPVLAVSACEGIEVQPHCVR